MVIKCNHSKAILDFFLVASIWNRVSCSIVCSQTWYVAKDVLRILILQPSPPEFWDCTLMSQTLVYEVFGNWAQCWCMRSVYSTKGSASQPVARSVKYRSLIASLHAISSVSYKAGWLSHRGLQVLQRSKSESDSLRLYDALWRRGTLLSMTHLREEECCFLWSTSGRNGSGGSQGELFASDSLIVKYTTW